MLAALLAAAAALAYRPILSAGWVYDDEAQILWDGFIHERANLADVLTLRVLARDVLDYNRPANLLSLMLDSAVWGRNPFGYHLTNILLHGAVAVLLFLVLLDILTRTGSLPQPGTDTPTPQPDLRTTGAAWLAALLFALHPLTAEPVCSPGFREDLLAALFTLLALVLAARYMSAGPLRKPMAAAIAGCCLAAVASKENGAAAPAILLAYVIAFRRSEPRRTWAWVIGVSAALAAGFLALRFWMEPPNSLIFSGRPAYGPGTWQTLLVLQPRIWAGQLHLILWPTWLCADYGAYCLRHLPLALSVAVLTAAGVCMIWLSRKSRIAGFAAALYLLAILPVSNLVPIYIPMADRYLYLPLVAAAVLAAAAIRRGLTLPGAALRMATLAAAVLAALLLLRLTVARETVWHDKLALWSDTWSRNPRSATAANNLASALLDQGRNEEALRMADTAIRLSGNRSAGAWYQRSLILRSLNNTPAAEEAAQRAKELDYRYRDPDLMRRGLILPP